MAAALLVLLAAGPAAARVTVTSPDAVSGGEGGKLIWTIPNESETAMTTKVEVSLPADNPFPEVSVKPHAGWSITETETTLDKPLKTDGVTLTKFISTITWTAQKGLGIKNGEFDEFEVSVGPFPKQPGELSLPATQTYSDGSVIEWDEVTTAGEVEPEHPAPMLRVAAAHAPAGSNISESHSDAAARWLATMGVALAAAALIVPVLRRWRQQA